MNFGIFVEIQIKKFFDRSTEVRLSCYMEYIVGRYLVSLLGVLRNRNQKGTVTFCLSGTGTAKNAITKVISYHRLLLTLKRQVFYV
jgi:hypothetical protein